jgi:hypothetical protein
VADLVRRRGLEVELAGYDAVAVVEIEGKGAVEDRASKLSKAGSAWRIPSSGSASMMSDARRSSKGSVRRTLDVLPMTFEGRLALRSASIVTTTSSTNCISHCAAARSKARSAAG